MSTRGRQNPDGGIQRSAWSCRRASRIPTRRSCAGVRRWSLNRPSKPPHQHARVGHRDACVLGHDDERAVTRADRLRDAEVGLASQCGEPGHLRLDGLRGVHVGSIDPQHEPPSRRSRPGMWCWPRGAGASAARPRRRMRPRPCARVAEAAGAEHAGSGTPSRRDERDVPATGQGPRGRSGRRPARSRAGRGSRRRWSRRAAGRRRRASGRRPRRWPGRAATWARRSGAGRARTRARGRSRRAGARRRRAARPGGRAGAPARTARASSRGSPSPPAHRHRQRDVLGRRQVADEPRLLADDADMAAPERRRLGRIEPGDHLARARSPPAAGRSIPASRRRSVLLPEPGPPGQRGHAARRELRRAAVEHRPLAPALAVAHVHVAQLGRGARGRGGRAGARGRPPATSSPRLARRA